MQRVRHFTLTDILSLTAGIMLIVVCYAAATRGAPRTSSFGLCPTHADEASAQTRESQVFDVNVMCSSDFSLGQHPLLLLNREVQLDGRPASRCFTDRNITLMYGHDLKND
jgi:hypothetical protein